MDKDIKKTETTEIPAKDEGTDYLFVTEGISIKANSLEEATKIYEKILKQNKESDND